MIITDGQSIEATIVGGLITAKNVTDVVVSTALFIVIDGECPSESNKNACVRFSTRTRQHSPDSWYRASDKTTYSLEFFHALLISLVCFM